MISSKTVNFNLLTEILKLFTEI